MSNRKPIVIGGAGQFQQIQAGDVLVDASGAAYLTATLTLTNTHIFVGNASNVATDVALSGDGTLANTGAITITKTGGVAFGYFATGTDASNLTGTLAYARLASQAASTLLGRDAAGAGVPEVITLGSGLSMSGTTLSATGTGGTVTSVTSSSGDLTVATGTTTPVLTVVSAPKWTTGRTITLTGDTTGVSGSFDGAGNLSFATTGVQAAKWTTARTLSFTGDVTGSGSVDGSAGVATALTIGANKVTRAMQAQGGALTVIGRSANTTGDVADIAAVAASGAVLRESGSALSFGTVATAGIANSAVTLAKIANAAANNRYLGSGSAGSGAAYTENTFTAGTGITITNGAAGITIAATGSTTPTTNIFGPQGRLTLVTGVPVMTSDQTAKTHVYYTPFVGPNVPIYDGSNWGFYTVGADLDMALDTTNQLSNFVYDIFAWNNAGTLSIGAGPAWITSATITVTIATPAVVTWTAHGLYEDCPVIFTTTGALPTGITAGTTYFVSRSPAANTFNISTTVANAAAGTFVNTSGTQSGVHTGTNHNVVRGTGAGTTELELKNGIWTNKNSITLTNGAGAGTAGIAANTATYLGTVIMTANGQTAVQYRSAAAAGGGNPSMCVWNAYNRVRTVCRAQDNTASWTYGSSTWRSADNSISNRITFVDGLQQSPVTAIAHGFFFSASNQVAAIGSDLNSTNSTPTLTSQGQTGGATNTSGTLHVEETFNPILGAGYVQQVEAGLQGASNITFLGAFGGAQSQQVTIIMDA